MRMLFPGVRTRRSIDLLLSRFFHGHRTADFTRAIGSLSRFYKLPRPPVRWYEYIDWGKTVGRTYENGEIHLVHPENWKRGRKYNSERQWVHAVYHEMAHYVLWSDAERKADGFAHHFVRGVPRPLRNGSRPHVALASRARRKHGRRVASRRRAA